MNMNEALKRDQEELKSLFSEDELEFKFWDLGRSYSSHQLVSINGKPLEEGKRVIFYFYQDDIYIPFDKRNPDYKGTLIGYDYGGQCNVAKFYYQNKLNKSMNEKLSIVTVLKELYSNAKRNG